jgi:4-hydroxy-3-polyprenylbenzoate decarboxylase
MSYTGGAVLADYVVGITGASGSIYGIRLIEELARAQQTVHVVVTSAGKEVMREEIGLPDIRKILSSRKTEGRISIWEHDDFSAPFMSGSNPPGAVIVIPCSMGNLAAIANGMSDNLLERTSDVALKEKKPLILVVRETPLSLIHIENMLKAARAGAHMVPAMPAFYHHPETVDDVVNFIVGKVLNLLSIRHTLFAPWGEKGEDHGIS